MSKTFKIMKGAFPLCTGSSASGMTGVLARETGLDSTSLKSITDAWANGGTLSLPTRDGKVLVLTSAGKDYMPDPTEPSNTPKTKFDTIVNWMVCIGLVFVAIKITPVIVGVIWSILTM